MPSINSHRALSALQMELLPHLGGILDLCSNILPGAQRHPGCPEEFHESLERIQRSTKDLRSLVMKGSDEAGWRDFRHHARNLISVTINEAEDWCEEPRAPFIEVFEDDLHKVKQLADIILESIRKDYAAPDNIAPTEKDDGDPQESAITGRILVVDDNEITRDLLCRRLKKAGHTVDIARDGRVALQMIRSQSFDLILLDLIMPELNGWQVLEQLKMDSTLNDLPVIMISALDELQSVVQCIEKGADDYLSRPVNPVLLRARISACLEKKQLRDREASYLMEIERANKRANDVLHAVFPGPIVESLRGTSRPAPRRHENVAVLFADIVAFTRYCDNHDPEEVVHHLNALVNSWENSAQQYGVQKIKTIGDAFMAAAGLLDMVDNPVLCCLRCGGDMIKAVQRLTPHWDLRVGIHIGPVVAGLIGNRQYLYDLWGDTVNTAARMESHGLPRKITLSRKAWEHVKHLCRGSERTEEVKGKGPLHMVDFDRFMTTLGK